MMPEATDSVDDRCPLYLDEKKKGQIETYQRMIKERNPSFAMGDLQNAKGERGKKRYFQHQVCCTRCFPRSDAV